MHGYENFLVKNSTSTGGGTIIQIHKGYSTLREIETTLPETIGVTIEKSYQFNVGVTNNKHRNNKLVFVEEFDNFFEKLSLVDTPFRITGDFNINTLDKNKLTNDLMSFLQIALKNPPISLLVPQIPQIALIKLYTQIYHKKLMFLIIGCFLIVIL